LVGLPAIAVGDDLGIGSVWNSLSPLVLAVLIGLLVWVMLRTVFDRDE
jgi:hypothetical protein